MKFSATIAVLCNILVISQGQLFGAMGGMGSEKCVDSSQCPTGQCCAGVTPFSGVCRPFTKEGMPCKNNSPFFTGISKVTCPCDEGLECVETTVGKKTKGTCQVPPPPSTTVAPASSEENPQEPNNPEQSSESDGTSSGETGSAQSAEQSQEQAVSENEQSEAEAQESGEAESAGSDDADAAE